MEQGYEWNVDDWVADAAHTLVPGKRDVKLGRNQCIQMESFKTSSSWEEP
jgi:hypothetical protein